MVSRILNVFITFMICVTVYVGGLKAFLMTFFWKNVSVMEFISNIGTINPWWRLLFITLTTIYFTICVYGIYLFSGVDPKEDKTESK